MGEFVFIEEEKYSEKSGIGLYRSKEPIPLNHPFVGGGYISNKKWPLIEECTIYNVQHLIQGTMSLSAWGLSKVYFYFP